MENIKGSINKEVIDTLVSLTRNILGDKAVDQILNNIAKKVGDNLTGRDIVFAFADEIQNIYGQNGGYAIVRQLGREVAKVLMEKHPKEEWEELFEKALNEFGFAYKIERNESEAYIYSCVFYEGVLKPRNLEPIEHCICWYGLGFIEGFVRALEEDVKGVQWGGRDHENEKCKFVYVK